MALIRFLSSMADFVSSMADFLASMAGLTDQNDLYVVGRIEGSNPADGALVRDERQTDTHWRAKGGQGSFNYRWNFDVQVCILLLI